MAGKGVLLCHGSLSEWLRISNGEFDLIDVQLALLYSYIDILKYMLSKCEIDVTEEYEGFNKQKTTCVREAFTHTKQEILKLLLENSSKEPSKEELTKLLSETYLHPDRIENDRLLLEHGADPNIMMYGIAYSLIDEKIQKGNYEYVKMLLEFGADKSKYMEWCNKWGDDPNSSWFNPGSIYKYCFSPHSPFEEIPLKYRERMKKIILETEPIPRNAKYVKGAKKL